MSNRRDAIRFVTTTAVAFVCVGNCLRALAETPLLQEGEPMAKSLKYSANSKKTDVCARCANYAPLAAHPGTGLCKQFPMRRVSGTGWCEKFSP